MEVEMKIRGLMVDPSTNMPVVILKDLQRDGAADLGGLHEVNAIILKWRRRRPRGR